MVTENKPKITLRKIRKTKNRLGGVGKIYMKFGETIDVRQYLESKQLKELTQPIFQKTALMVTNDLILTQTA